MIQRVFGKDAKAGGAAFAALLAVYAATLAPAVTYWDSGEFLAAIHSLGIPHPPGTPLYVLAANVWARIFGPAFGFAGAVNLFSAVCAAAGCALIANLVSRWTGDPYRGFAAAVCAGGMSSLWLSATEAEVYAPAFLVAMLLVWIADRRGDTADSKYFGLLLYVAGLGWALHLTALIALPAALVLVAHGTRPRVRELLPAAALALLGASAVFYMYFRARHDPGVNQGNPVSLSALWDVITRRQYGEMSFWPRQAPLYLQFGNVFEWADWQFALGLNSAQPPSILRTPVTVLFGFLGVIGASAHRRAHRASWRAAAVLFVTAFAGVVFYLNLKAGPSYGAGFLPENALHEARERDYFFILAWVVWGAWAGVGAIALAERVSGRRALPLGLLVAAMPVVMNWRAVDRSNPPRSREAETRAAEILLSAPGNAVVFARGDNDTYPVWYLQEVERVRPDVVSITLPMLSAQWYRAEIARRHGLLDGRSVTVWLGMDSTVRVICEKGRRQSRSLPAACAF